MAGHVKAYRNFVLSLTPNHEENGGEWLKAWVIESPAGELPPSKADKVEFPARLRSRIEALERRQLDLEGLIALGEELAALLLPPGVRDLYRRSLDRLGAREGLRVQIRADSPELGALPWEYAYVGDPDVPAERKGREGFLALDRRISLVRFEALEDSAKPDTVPPGDLRLAILLSDVHDPAYPPLDLAQEEVNLRQALEGVRGVQPSYLRPGTRDKLADLVNTRGAQILHFSGHGEFPLEQADNPGTYEGLGRLILAGDDGRPDPWEATEFAEYLKGLDIRLAVLGACEAARRDAVTPWSSVATALVRAKIPAVVGMQYTIRDGNAVEFSRGLYQALASGHSIDAAVSKGRMEIFNRSGPSERDWGVPVLYLREQDSNIQLFPKDMRPVHKNAALAFAASVLLLAWFVLHILPLAEQWRDKTFGWLGLPVSAGLLILWLVNWVYQQFKTALWNWNDLPILDWLHGARARRLAVFSLAFSALLLFSTSSIYLVDDGGATVEITHDGSKRLLGEPGDYGGPLFFKWGAKFDVSVRTPRKWNLTVNGKAEGDSTSVTLWHWSPFIRLGVSKPNWRVFQIIPEPDLVAPMLTSPANDGSPLVFSLEVGIGENAPLTLHAWKGEVVYVGAEKGAMKEMVAGYPSDVDKQKCAGNSSEAMSTWSEQRFLPEGDSDGPAWEGPTQKIALTVVATRDGKKYRFANTIVFEDAKDSDDLPRGLIVNHCLRRSDSQSRR